MKQFIPMVLMVSAPLMGMGQTKSGLVMSNLDTAVKPADDFYRFATGGWQKNNPLPAAYSRFGSFDQLQEQARVFRTASCATMSTVPCFPIHVPDLTTLIGNLSMRFMSSIYSIHT